MARINVYLPDDLAAEVKAADLNVSKITQEALAAELRRKRTREWLDELRRIPPSGVTHEQALAALDEAREEFGA